MSNGKTGEPGRGCGKNRSGRRQTIIACKGCGKALYLCDAAGNEKHGLYHPECRPEDYPTTVTYNFNGKECTKEEFDKLGGRV